VTNAPVHSLSTITETSSSLIVPNHPRRPLEGQVGETENSFRKECLESYFYGYLAAFPPFMGRKQKPGSSHRINSRRVV
jgi:hypothetical protein